MSETYQGSCHCGAVKFSYSGEKIEKGLRCNCSICSRKGAMMSIEVIPEDKLEILAKGDSLGLYQFGQKTAKHFFCRECGIYPFHETARFPGHYRVNLGCIDEIDTFELKFDVFDGKHQL
jgi:hypothetical protein